MAMDTSGKILAVHVPYSSHQLAHTGMLQSMPSTTTTFCSTVCMRSSVIHCAIMTVFIIAKERFKAMTEVPLTYGSMNTEIGYCRLLTRLRLYMCDVFPEEFNVQCCSGPLVKDPTQLSVTPANVGNSCVGITCSVLV